MSSHVDSGHGEHRHDGDELAGLCLVLLTAAAATVLLPASGGRWRWLVAAVPAVGTGGIRLTAPSLTALCVSRT